MGNNLPQVVLFQEDEKALNYKYKLPFNLNSNIKVISIDYDLEEFKNKGNKIIGPRPVKDAIYYLHPYKNNEYVHESMSEMYFLNEKLNLYRRVGQLLGAKSIKTKIILTESKKLEIDVEGNLKVKLVTGSTNVKHSSDSKYKNDYEISETYEMLENFDINKNVDELHRMIEEYNLHHEQDIVTLVEARDSRISGTIMKTRKVRSEITSEYNSLLTISAQLSAPVFNVGADFKRSLETVNKLSIDIEFNF